MGEKTAEEQVARESLLEGVPTKINGRHAFIHERLLIIIARETEARGGYSSRKRETANLLGCGVPSIDRAVRSLRREELIKSSPKFGAAGEQLENEYRATYKGLQQADKLLRHATPKLPRGL